MAPGEKGSKRPRISVWAYDVRKKGRIFGSGSRGNWKAKKRLVKKSMAKKAACLHWFVCCCVLLLFNVSQWRCLLFIEFVVLESAFLLMMILHISGTNIHLIEMLFKENMFPIKGPGPFQQVCQRPIGHSSNQVSQILGNKRRATLVWNILLQSSRQDWFNDTTGNLMSGSVFLCFSKNLILALCFSFEVYD